jgi:hypothetical protein
MSAASRVRDEVEAFETLMLEHFRAEPFHNLGFIYRNSLSAAVRGGTCFYKTRSIIDAGKKAGFQVFWHNGVIYTQGAEWMHWVARVHIDGRLFFADMGNGWPSLKLYPADREVAHRICGMGFRTEIANGRVSVFHEKQGKESRQLEIDVQPKPEDELLADLERRASLGHVYPVNSLRFSQVVGERFLFLRGDRLEIYGDDTFECVEGIEEQQVPAVLRAYFGVDLKVGINTSVVDRQVGVASE